MGRKSNRQNKGRREGVIGNNDNNGDMVKDAGLTTGEASGEPADMIEKLDVDKYSLIDIGKAMRDGSRSPADRNCH
jgi:hypothetical protein